MNDQEEHECRLEKSLDRNFHGQVRIEVIAHLSVAIHNFSDFQNFEDLDYAGCPNQLGRQTITANRASLARLKRAYNDIKRQDCHHVEHEPAPQVVHEYFLSVSHWLIGGSLLHD